MAQFTFIPSAEAPELADDIRRLFDDLAASLPREHRAWSGECHPTLDVIETDQAVEIVMDVCGVAPQAIRVLFRDDVLALGSKSAKALDVIFARVQARNGISDGDVETLIENFEQGQGDDSPSV